MGDDALISGGQGGYVNLSSPSTAVAEAMPYTNSNPVFGSPTIEFSTTGNSTGTTSSSILYIGLFGLIVLWIVKEWF